MNHCMNIDARSAGPPSFVRQPAIYQQNLKELHAPKEDKQGAQRWWAVREGVCHGGARAPWGKTFGEMLPSNIDSIRG